MTSLDVALVAASSPAMQVPTPVKKRESLHRGAIVEIKIPAECREGTFEDIHFIQFARHVKGGVVNVFVHGENPTQYCGLAITAEVEVMLKEFDDGRSFIHVDLRPTEAAATHRLVVMQDLPETWSPKNFSPVPEDCIIFKTLVPLMGAVVLIPTTARMRNAYGKIITPATSTTGNATADRMIAREGWEFASEDENTIYLKKMVGEQTKTHQIQKPKAKVKKKK